MAIKSRGKIQSYLGNKLFVVNTSLLANISLILKSFPITFFYWFSHITLIYVFSLIGINMLCSSFMICKGSHCLTLPKQIIFSLSKSVKKSNKFQKCKSQAFAANLPFNLPKQRGGPRPIETFPKNHLFLKSKASLAFNISVIYRFTAQKSWPDPLNRISHNNHNHEFDSAFIHQCLRAIYHIVLINTFKN